MQPRSDTTCDQVYFMYGHYPTFYMINCATYIMVNFTSFCMVQLVNCDFLRAKLSDNTLSTIERYHVSHLNLSNTVQKMTFQKESWDKPLTCKLKLTSLACFGYKWQKIF